MEPVKFGEETPEGRMTGDCDLCFGDEVACDCQLSFTTIPGAKVSFFVSSDPARAEEATAVLVPQIEERF